MNNGLLTSPRMPERPHIGRIGGCGWILFLTAMLIGGPLRAQMPANSGQTFSRSAETSNQDQLYRELAQEAEFLDRESKLLQKVIDVVTPSVAHIEAKKRSPAATSPRSDSNIRRPVVIEEAGAGIVIQRDNRYYVVTNFHVVESSSIEDITVEVDGRLFSPSRLMHDPETDLSVIGLADRNLRPARIGNSDRVKIGEFVLAFGSPFGLSHSASYGIISAANRHDLDLGPQGVRYQNFFQTDAAINPGNSGGPLINLRGEIIGINTAIASNSGGNDGIGFSIPINMAMRIVEDLIDYGQVKRGFLGVSLDSRYTYAKGRSLGLDLSYGTLVTAITPNSPAAESELQVGDVILEYDGKRIQNDSQLVTRVSLTPLGDEVTLTVFRRGRYLKLKSVIRNRSEFEASN